MKATNTNTAEEIKMITTETMKLVRSCGKTNSESSRSHKQNTENAHPNKPQT